MGNGRPGLESQRHGPHWQLPPCRSHGVYVLATVLLCGPGGGAVTPRNPRLLVLVPVPWSLGRTTSRRTRPGRTGTLPIQSWPAGGPGRARAHGGPAARGPGGADSGGTY